MTVTVINAADMRPLTQLWRVQEYLHDCGTISIRIPVLASGEVDPMRRPLVTGHTTFGSHGGGFAPLNFDIDGATDLAQAVAGWPAAVRKALDDINAKQLRDAVVKQGKPS